MNRPLVARTKWDDPACIRPLTVETLELSSLEFLVVPNCVTTPCVLTCNFNVIMLANVVVCLSVIVKLLANVFVRTELVTRVTLLLAGVRLMLVTVEVAAVIGLLVCYNCVTDL